MIRTARSLRQQASQALLLHHISSQQACHWATAVIQQNLPQALLLLLRQASTSAGPRQKIIFLGTPLVAAEVLQDLVAASKSKDAAFEVCAIVTKSPTARPDEKHSNNQVWNAAAKLGFSQHQIFAPASPKQPDFLAAMTRLAPDLCITAAYGGLLPQAFLDIPRCGTVNIHPSLLPKYRGAAPVQRALANGEPEAGVSVAYTILKCDAGPVLEQARLPLAGDEQCPELTSRLFKMGSEILLRRMHDILEGRGLEMALPQDQSLATLAPKVQREEAKLDLSLTAERLHNQVRALAGWPGTHVNLMLHDLQAGSSAMIQVHVLRTRVVREIPQALQQLTASKQADELPRVQYVEGRMLLPCGGNTLLEVLEVKPRIITPRHKSVSGTDFMRQLGRKCRLIIPEQEQSIGGSDSAEPPAG